MFHFLKTTVDLVLARVPNTIIIMYLKKLMNLLDH